MSRRRKLPGLTLMEESFCQLVALGKTARDAYAESFGVAVLDERTKRKVDNRASRLMAKPAIAARIDEAQGAAKRANRKKWENRGEDLAERIYQSVLAADERGELLTKDALKGVEVLARMKGLNAPEETVLKNGGMAEDFTPRGVEAMSDADLRAIIDREERTIDVTPGGGAAETAGPESAEAGA